MCLIDWDQRWYDLVMRYALMILQLMKRMLFIINDFHDSKFFISRYQKSRIVPKEYDIKSKISFVNELVLFTNFYFREKKQLITKFAQREFKNSKESISSCRGYKPTSRIRGDSSRFYKFRWSNWIIHMLWHAFICLTCQHAVYF